MALDYSNYKNSAPTGYTWSSEELAKNRTFEDSKKDSDDNKKISHLFRNTKGFRDVTKYNLMRGVPDFGSLVQFNPYETGYAAFIICGMPKFMEMLAAVDTDYRQLVENWKHIIEYEFKSIDGFQDLNADTYTLGDDLNNINVISKVNMQSASDFSLTY